MWGEEGPGAGPRAKGFSHTQGRARVQLLGRAVEAAGGPAGQGQPCRPIYTKSPRLHDSTAGPRPLWPATLILSIPKCLLSWAQWFHLGTPPTPILRREAVSREEGGWGQGWRHPGRPPGLTQENLRVGKIPGCHPQPRHRILVPTETLRSPPC